MTRSNLAIENIARFKFVQDGLAIAKLFWLNIFDFCIAGKSRKDIELHNTFGHNRAPCILQKVYKVASTMTKVLF